MTDATVRFGVLCSMFQAMLRDRSSAKKRKRLRTFLDRVYTGQEYFSAIRLILPSLDRERGSYGLKESALAACLVEALGISKDSEDALRLVNWRKGGARTGANAGNFALVAAEVLQRRQGMTSGGLTIKEVNDALGELASKENRADKASILSDLIKRTNAVEMKWILTIILKDMKLGISEKSIFHEFHPDAEDLFNVTCDLKLVCEKLRDRTQRHKRQDIEVGKAVRPQLATRVSDATAAWRKLHGKQVVVECKFDGDRIQIHKSGADIHYFSRNFLDHLEYAHGMSDIIVRNVLVDRCILDGEMLVWDKSTERFAEFGSNQEIAKAAREGLESDRQLCYVVFDILYVGDTSVIHQSLAERQSLLRKTVIPAKGQLEILVPDGGLNEHRSPDEPCWSIIAHTTDDVENFFRHTIENRDEGIVLKDLDSKWEPGDRSGKWLKLKPDYIHAGADLDVLIIGGYFGSGRHGGEVAQFLVGLAEHTDADTHPRRFLSFCRVGTGLSDDELDALISRLKPHFRKNEHPKKAPRFYELTNNSKERPDVWIESPDKSVIVSVTSDIRTIKSEVFAAPYSLRFPRILRVRYDKPWNECLVVQSFVDMVHSSNGSMQKGTDNRGLHDNSSKRAKVSRKGKMKKISVVPTHLIKTDVSEIKKESYIFTDLTFYFANAPSSYSIDYFHKLVAEHGGTFSMNLNDRVTHCIAAEKKGIKYEAATRHGDIIHYSWFLDCCSQKHLLHLQPKYFLFLTDLTKSKFQEEMDSFSDYYYCDLDVNDIKQILCNMNIFEDSKSMDYYHRKYALEGFCFFQGLHIYFAEVSTEIGVPYKLISELAIRRMQVEVATHGGEVTTSLPKATHLVVYSIFNSDDIFEVLYKRFPSSQRWPLCGEKLHVVKHQWLEDSLNKSCKLPEGSYNLKPETSENLEIQPRWPESPVCVSLEPCGSQSLEVSVKQYDEKEQTRAKILSRDEKIKEGHARANRKEGVMKHPRRTLARIGTRPARIGSYELNESLPAHINFECREGSSGGIDSKILNDLEDTGGINDSREIQSTEQVVVSDCLGSEMFSSGCSKAELKFFSENDNKTEKCDNVCTKGELENDIVVNPEHRCDPLQAMLLDMIPSFSQKKKETGERPQESGKSQREAVESPAKKKKVSYKDVAGQLLEDW